VSRVLVVDDQPDMAEILQEQLEDSGYTVQIAIGGREALALAARLPPDVVITDLHMPGVDGFGVLTGIQAIDPRIPVLMLTAFGQVTDAVAAIQKGAFHYLTKPYRLQELLVYLGRALEGRRLREENQRLQALTPAGQLHRMVGASSAMRHLYTQIQRLAQASAPVLIRGESGTGKELTAQALHDLGPRRERPFVAINCTTLPQNLLESELFGHVKGSFTGAVTNRKGLFVEADGGTLFLDEIGDMPTDLQSRLLRVLQEGVVRPVGGDRSQSVDVRVIAATHQPLEARVESGDFRADLFYRLNVVPLRVPPLRDRVEDIPALLETFLARARLENPASAVERFSPRLLVALARRPWPGNIRELENAVRRIVILTPDSVADIDALDWLDPREEPTAAPAPPPPAASAPLTEDRIRPLKDIETEYIAQAIAACQGNKTRAAERLGINVSTIHRRIPHG
jgi:two-component system response regulator HydG